MDFLGDVGFREFRPGVGIHVFAAEAVDRLQIASKETVKIAIQILRVDPQLSPVHFQDLIDVIGIKRIAQAADDDIKLFLHRTVILSVFPKDRKRFRPGHVPSLTVDQISQQFLSLGTVERDDIAIFSFA